MIELATMVNGSNTYSLFAFSFCKRAGKLLMALPRYFFDPRKHEKSHLWMVYCTEASWTVHQNLFLCLCGCIHQKVGYKTEVSG